MLGLPSSLPESGLPVFLSQVPLVIYFVVSLQDLPVDVAIVRFVTSYTIPLLLWITLSWVRGRSISSLSGAIVGDRSGAPDTRLRASRAPSWAYSSSSCCGTF